MSAPEMPAKEVTPEFGFREASPSVAAAALAALKTGRTGNGRRTRGATSRRGATPSEEPPGERVAAAVPAESEGADEEGRRRRRRRGGRGRGRSRREETPTAPVVGADEEIGWEEFDDLSQLDGPDGDREYTFEEADAATLAELGIDPADLTPAEAPAETEEKPKRRSRSTKAAAAAAEKPQSRSRRSTAKPAAESPAVATKTEEKPKRRSRSTKAAGEAEEKPKTPSRRSTAKSTTEAPDERGSENQAVGAQPQDGGEPQGIWGRFRSARPSRTTPST
jgi:hypothetical protein